MSDVNSNGVICLRAGAAWLRIVPALGGRATECMLETGDGSVRAALHPYPENHVDLDHWAKGGVYPLVPYSGRIRNATLNHAGRDWPLHAHMGSAHTLHGIAQRRAWRCVSQAHMTTTLAYAHRPDAHWPWAFEATLEYALAPNALTVTVALQNTGDSSMPGGIGLHPYLPHGDHAALAYTASAPWPFDEDVLALPMEFSPHALHEHTIQASAYEQADLTLFHAAIGGPVRLRAPDTGQTRLTVSASGALTQWVIHRPVNAAFVCVEPASHVPDGFNLAARGQGGTGTRILAPGELMRGAMVIATHDL
jgi:aldose 1-epimerase